MSAYNFLKPDGEETDGDDEEDEEDEEEGPAIRERVPTNGCLRKHERQEAPRRGSDKSRGQARGLSRKSSSTRQ